MASIYVGSSPNAFRRAGVRLACAAAYLLMLQGCGSMSFESGRPDTPYGDYLAGRHAATTYDAKAAQKYFSGALTAEPDNPFILDHAFVVTVNAADMDRAVELAKRLVVVSPDNRLARLVLAIADIKEQKYQEAIAQIGSVESSAFAALIGSLTQAWAAAGLGDRKLVDDKLASLDDKPVFDVFRAYHQALILDMLGDAEGAETAYKSAVDTTSSASIRIVLAYASFLERHNRSKEALEQLQQFAAVSPDHPLIKKALDDLAQGKIAPPLVANAVEGTAEVFYGLGSTLTQDRGNNLASVYLQFALYLRPDFDVDRTLLASAYEEQERWDDAIEVYDELDSSSPLYQNAQIRKALVLARQKKDDEAIALFRRLTDDNPKSLEPLVAFGDYYRSNEKYAEALEQYNKAIAVSGEPTENRWPLYYARGICYERLNQWALAERDLKLALKLSDENAQVLNYLGYSWIEQGLNLQEALHMIEKAVDARPSDGFIVDSLGWAHYRLGDYPQAVKYLQQAVVLQAGDPTINEHLGDAFWKVGRRLEAKFQWRHALDMKPEEGRKVALKSKIQNGLDDSNAASQTEPPVTPTASPVRSGAPAS